MWLADTTSAFAGATREAPSREHGVVYARGDARRGQKFNVVRSKAAQPEGDAV